MSKNLTRKGLVLGTVAALVSTVFAGSPANAAGEVVFEPSTGTSYNTFVTEPLTLAASLAAGQVAGNIVQLKYAVTVPTGVTLQHKVNGASSFTDLAATGVVSGSGSASAANTILVGIKYTTGTTDPVATSDSVAVAVTAFLDSDNDGAVDAGEYQQARTINFKKYSEVVPTVSITAPATADASVKATVALADLNVEQLGVTATAKGDVDVTFTNSGTGTLDAATTKAAGVYTNTFSAGTLAAAATVTARATYKTVALGSAAVSATVAARTIIQPTAAVVAGVNGVVSGNVARTNSAFSVAATIKDTASTAVVKSGVAVSAVVSSFGTLSATRTLSINGTVYTANSAVPASLALTSGTTGLATVDLVTVGFSATDAPVVTFSAQNFSVAVTVDLQDAAYTVVSNAVGSALRSITEGGTTTFNFVVNDQFGVAIGSGARLEAVVGYSTPVTSYVAVSNGTASVTVVDTTASTAAAISVDTTLQTQSVATSNWTSTSVTSATQTANVTATALTFDTAPAAQSIALATSVALTTSSLSNAGAPVTVSAKGFTFIVNSKEYVDTVTLFSGTAGDIVINAKSTVSGATTVTYTAGAEVKTAVVTVAYPAADKGKSIDLTSVPKYSLPGSTLVVTGYVKDTYGNGVPSAATSPTTFSITYTGPGFVVGTLPTTTDSTGKFTFSVITGAADTAEAKIVVKYDADGATTTIAELSATAIVALGVAPAVPPTAKVTASKGLFYLAIAGNDTGKTVVVKVAGKTFKYLKGSKANKLYTVRAPKGSHKVSVYVSNELLLTKTIVVK